MALPEHEITQPLHARGAHQEIERGQAGREHVLVEGFGGDGFRVRIVPLRRFEEGAEGILVSPAGRGRDGFGGGCGV